MISECLQRIIGRPLRMQCVRFVCVHVYVCVCVCMCAYVYVCACVRMCTCVHVCMCTYVYVCACVRVCVSERDEHAKVRYEHRIDIQCLLTTCVNTSYLSLCSSLSL